MAGTATTLDRISRSDDDVEEDQDQGGDDDDGNGDFYERNCKLRRHWRQVFE